MRPLQNQKTPEDFPAYVDSLKQAVAELVARGYPCDAAHLQKAKRDRPPGAFKGTRVHFIQSLLDWLVANPYGAPLPDAPEDDDALEDKQTLERRKLREQFLAARHRRLVEEGRYIAKAEIIERDIIAVAQFRASLNGLRSDAPQWSGLPPYDILRRVSEKIDAALREIEAAFRKKATI